MERVIFACIHNAGRSQMAAAFFSAVADPAQATAVSAGTQPGDHVNPAVIEAMREVGIDLSAAHPQRLTDRLTQDASLLITMGCGDECPYVPGLARDDWPLPDPNSRSLDEVRQNSRRGPPSCCDARSIARLDECLTAVASFTFCPRQRPVASPSREQ
jgi:arsenate reductase